MMHNYADMSGRNHSSRVAGVAGPAFGVEGQVVPLTNKKSHCFQNARSVDLKI